MLGNGLEVATVAHSASKGSLKVPDEADADEGRIVEDVVGAVIGAAPVVVIVPAVPLPLKVAQLLD